jgi:nucleoside-diphosphate-sugar epimerase
MRVFIAGATGVIGKRLTRLLTARGDSVTGLTRTPEKRRMLEELGARAVVADALDPHAVGRAISEAEPEVVVHQLTAVSQLGSIRNFDDAFAQNARLRSEGTDILLSTSRAAGIRIFVAQSFAGFLFARDGTPLVAENDELAQPPRHMARASNADRRREWRDFLHPHR